jgi:hypothetical protein
VVDQDDFSWLDSDPFAGDGDELETTRQLASPCTYARREATRQFISGLKREALNDLIPILPPPDTDLYVIGNGAGAEIRHGINPQAFDFGSFIPHIVEMLGGRDCVAYISSWTLNRQHAKTLIEMLDDKRLSALTVCTDPYFKRREAAIATELIMGLQQRGQRFLAFKNHVKAICISNPDGRTCTVTGSANLSAQPRCEQYVLTTDPGVYQFFHDEFFEAMLTNAKTD